MREMSCTDLEKCHLEIMPGKEQEALHSLLNGKNIMVLHNCLLYVYEHKKEFDKSPGSFCDLCWETVEAMLDEFSATLDHFYHEHNPKLN